MSNRKVSCSWTAALRTAAAVGTLAVAGAPALAHARQSPRSTPCGPGPSCPDSLFWVAVPAKFSVGTQPGGGQQVTVTVRVLNAARRPLVLEARREAATLHDDLQNVYVVPADAAVHGIGLVRGAAIDSQFTVAPGETRELSIDFVPRDPRARALGTRFDFTVALLPVVDGPGGRQWPGAGQGTSLHHADTGPETAAYAAQLLARVRDARASCGNDLRCLGTAIGGRGGAPGGDASSARSVAAQAPAPAPPAADRGVTDRTPSAAPATNRRRVARAQPPTDAGARPSAPASGQAADASDTAATTSAGQTVTGGASIGGLPGVVARSVRGAAGDAAAATATTVANTVRDVATSTANDASAAATGRIDSTTSTVNAAVARKGDVIKDGVHKLFRRH